MSPSSVLRNVWPNQGGPSWSGLPVLLWNALFRFPYPGNQAVLAGFRRWFPHVNPAKPRLGDPLRILLQLLWLLVVRPVPVRIRAVFGGAPRTFDERWARLMRRGRLSILLAWRRTRGDGRRWRQYSEVLAAHTFWDSRPMRYGAYGVAILLALTCITTPFSTYAQALFVILLWSLALVIRNIPGPVATLFLIVLSLTASTRYLWWRIAFTLNNDDWLDFSWGSVLLLAECYTWIALLLGYIQTSWPLRRKPVALPTDTSVWPTVDIYIPTYNEPLLVVKPTVYAALALDWPTDKLRVHILDDGKRDEFRRFAETCGANYLTRPDNRHAKAGNLNHALTKTSGEFIAIFDCDHIPTRSFLQVTMGQFLRDQKLALVQTPHHFFSPDPFERNLGLFRQVPNEGELFYGVIQDGNDLWNASFFCGSCAVLRRKPLEEVGGIAVETVTEDAHTALKMHRLGYRSAYINIAQAAGLATESLSAHVGQRIRWARGMAQIFRLDNPFLGKGLHWVQRVCYGNSMIHFLNGVPRLIFLTAPLAFLLFHAYVIYAPAISVALYVLPHMAHANLTNSRMQGGHRHSFWAEVYETVLAWYIARPTLVALIDPSKGKFNVTAKGGLTDKDYFDWGISRPYIVILVLNLIGAIAGVWRLFSGPDDEIPTVLINIFWVSYNLLLLGGAVSVASEARQVRRSHRVRMAIDAMLILSGGHALRCRTLDFSEGGTALDVDGLPPLRKDDAVQVSFWRGHEEFSFPALVTGTSGNQLRLRWAEMPMELESALIQCTFARADAWVTWADGRRRDVPLKGLRQVISIGFSGYRRMFELAMPNLAARSPLKSLAARVSSLMPRRPAPIGVSVVE
ncbi:MAG TPA: UDP-forming cellulose synthase catalytic subunit [Rhodocyclaceae bacterium]|nr:UDP-forming cellulose synthase catalytic subunit [Rhodocyclaceae bacterium]